VFWPPEGWAVPSSSSTCGFLYTNAFCGRRAMATSRLGCPFFSYPLSYLYCIPMHSVAEGLAVLATRRQGCIFFPAAGLVAACITLISVAEGMAIWPAEGWAVPSSYSPTSYLYTNGLCGRRVGCFGRRAVATSRQGCAFFPAAVPVAACFVYQRIL
jgi:hypothetical protein